MNRLDNVNNQLTKTQEFVYSVPTGPKVKGQTPIYRKPSQKNGLLQIPSEIKSLSDFWDLSLKKFPNNLLIQDFTFKQVDQMARRVGSWISSRGHKLYFLYSLNCPNWTICDIASWNYGIINVPLYDTLGEEAFDHILNVTQGTLLFTTKNLGDNLFNFLSHNKYNIKEVCFFDELTNEHKNKLQSIGIKVSSFKEALAHKNILQRPKMTLQTQLTYAFTSGTTGIPKGVVYTHKMPISQCYAMVGHYQLLPDDVHMSYLPIAHAFERYVIWTCIFFGTNIRYAKHPIAQILKDFAICKPTTIPIVPRLLNKFYPVLKGLYEKQGNYTKVRGIFGGRLKRLVTGSAPVSPAILKFFSQALGADIREGFGQTQSTAASFITYQGDTNYGHVGGPNAVTQFKLVDVPQMNYTTDGQLPKGQICMRGPSNIQRYFKDSKNTKQTVDKDGWNHTGDIGVILPNGALKIIDRKKNIYKLQQGQYVAPQKVENVYARCKYVAQSFLYGDSLSEFNIAIIHPNLDHLPTVAEHLGIKEKDVKKLCENPKITQFILDQITKQGKQDGLQGFEQAKKIKLWHEPFQTVGIVTSTMKLQRFIAKDKFKKQIEQLYK